MSVYKIKPLQEEKAKRLGVKIRPSTNKSKKIDVFKDGKRIASIGAMRKKSDIPYGDYATYIRTKGIKKANQIRNAYLARSAVNPMEKNGIKTRNYWAREILW